MAVGSNGQATQEHDERFSQLSGRRDNSSNVGSSVSKMQRASSLSKLKAIQEKNNMLGRTKEEEEEQAKLKKEKLDEIKKKYTQMGRRKAGSTSRRRIVSAKAESQSVMTDQVSAITTGIP